MNYTSIKQSKKLLELGLSSDTADMQWFLEETYGIVQVKEDLQNWGGDCTIPCWSVGALLEAMPKVINTQTFCLDTSSALWHLGYPTLNVERGDSLIDVVYKMVVWLLENNYIKKGE